MDIRLKEARLYKKTNEKVKCITCRRECIIEDGRLGFCRTRKNINGKLYTLVYGNISSISANPIEKKPLFHFYPGSLALTCGTYGCNFTCPWCQNYDISKLSPENGKRNYISPEEFIDLAKQYNCKGTSISFNEPTLLLEWSLELFGIAKKKGLYNTFVTNGYMGEEALDLLIENGLDAMNIDIKGNKEVVKKYCDADVNLAWGNCIRARKKGIHIEITTLVVPDVNDKEEIFNEISVKISNLLGKDVPWHITRYHPAYKFKKPKTPIEILEKAHNIGKRNGLKFVYIGNVPGHKYENTYCSSCNELLIRRYNFDIIEYRIKDGRCLNCREKIQGVGI